MGVFTNLRQRRLARRDNKRRSGVRRLNSHPVVARGLVTMALLGAIALSFGVLGSSPAAPETKAVGTTSPTGNSGNTGTAGGTPSATTTTTTTTTTPTTAPTTTTTTTAPRTTSTTTTTGSPGLSASPSTFNNGTVTWTGNGAEDGTCDTQSDDSIGPVPNGKTGWLFILTQPGSAPFELTTNLGDASGTQQGNGSVHFVLFSTLGDLLTSASAVTGTDGSVLTVSHCWNGAPLIPTTITTTVFDAGTGVAWSGTESVGAAANDTSDVGGVQEGTPLTGTVTYTFFTNGGCDGEGTAQTVDIIDGAIPPSPSTLSLAAGSYSYEAVYNGDSNYAASPTGECEPFSVGTAPSSTSTVLDDAATNAPWTGDETTGAQAYDTSTVSGGIEGFTPTGTVMYTLFDNGTCTSPAQADSNAHAIISTLTVTLNPDGTVPNSATTSPLTPGNYSFDASYSGDSNYDPSGVSECEPFSVNDGPTTTTTVLKDATTGQDWAGTETAGATAYDTSTVSGAAGGIAPTGTVTYSYFTNGTCNGTPVSTQDVTLNPDGSVPNSATTAPLVAGSYSFDAVYTGDDNYSASAVSACEPFTVAVVTSPSTVTPTNTPTLGSTAAPAAKGSAIAFTGADLAGMWAGAVALLGLGGLLVLASRRRKGQANHAE